MNSAWSGIKSAVGAVGVGCRRRCSRCSPSALQAIGGAATWLWQNAIMPAFNGIRTVIGLWWTGVQASLRRRQDGVQCPRPVVMWLWQNAIVPAFNGIQDRHRRVVERCGSTSPCSRPRSVWSGRW